MHPAYSVILFTTASGAGYGLLALLALGGALGLLPVTRGLGLSGFGLALTLVTAGLLASTFHLGRPERAWRAFSQWRSSWLSREGVAAVATYAPALAAAYGWVMLERADGAFALAGLATAVLCAITVGCTGMIYASLKTIRAWHNGLVVPVYLALALATGALLLTALLGLLDIAADGPVWLAVAAILLALGLKIVYWAGLDGGRRELTPGDATGLGSLGRVRPLDPPHTGPNYVMREMGYIVARKHAHKLRMLASLGLFHAPLVLLLVSLALPGGLRTVASLAAVAAAGLGVVIERWLFFAEAQHVVSLYYGADRA